METGSSNSIQVTSELRPHLTFPALSTHGTKDMHVFGVELPTLPSLVSSKDSSLFPLEDEWIMLYGGSMDPQTPHFGTVEEPRWMEDVDKTWEDIGREGSKPDRLLESSYEEEVAKTWEDTGREGSKPDSPLGSSHEEEEIATSTSEVENKNETKDGSPTESGEGQRLQKTKMAVEEVGKAARNTPAVVSAPPAVISLLQPSRPGPTPTNPQSSEQKQPRKLYLLEVLFFLQRSSCSDSHQASESERRSLFANNATRISTL